MKKRFLISFVLGCLCSLTTFAQTSFSVTVTGKGKPILFFPGFGCTGALWDETVKTLSNHYECHVFTFAGFGKVPAIPMPWLETIKTDILAYVQQNNLSRPLLVGHSLGGTLSLALAASEPTRFEKAILIDALPCTAALMIPNYKGERLSYDNPQSLQMLQMSTTAFEAMNAQTAAFMCRNPEKQKEITTMLNQSDRKTYVYGYIDMLNWDLREEIAKIKIPVVILAATLPSLDVVKKTYSEQFRNLPTVTIHYAENAAHFVMYDQPEWYMKQLQSAL